MLTHSLPHQSLQLDWGRVKAYYLSDGTHFSPPLPGSHTAGAMSGLHIMPPGFFLVLFTWCLLSPFQIVGSFLDLVLPFNQVTWKWSKIHQPAWKASISCVFKNCFFFKFLFCFLYLSDFVYIFAYILGQCFPLLLFFCFFL